MAARITSADQKCFEIPGVEDEGLDIQVEFTDDEGRGADKERFADIRWMEISDLLRRDSENGRKPVKQIVFEGKRLDAMSVRGWRDRALAG